MLSFAATPFYADVSDLLPAGVLLLLLAPSASFAFLFCLHCCRPSRPASFSWSPIKLRDTSLTCFWLCRIIIIIIVTRLASTPRRLH